MKWLGIKCGDVVSLKDIQTLKEISINGTDVVIKSIKKFKRDFATWILAELDTDNLYLVIKNCGNETDIRIMFKPPEIEFDDVESVLNQGNQWLFNEPDDIDNFKPCDLEMADSFDDGKVNFNKKCPTIHVEFYDGNSIDPKFGCVTEWIADSEHDNPEVICFEMGGIDDDGEIIPQGGFLMVLQGVTVNETNDVELFQT